MSVKMLDDSKTGWSELGCNDFLVIYHPLSSSSAIRFFLSFYCGIIRIGVDSISSLR